jgi:hypothetical protein
MSDEARWKIAQSHMSGHLAGQQAAERSEPDPGEFLRKAAAESAGFRMGQNSTESRAELQRNGGPESVITNAIKRVDRQMRASDAEAASLTQQAAVLKAKLRAGERGERGGER